MTCCMCSTTTAIIYWTIVIPLLKLERQVCNRCEVEYRRARAQRERRDAA